MSNNRIIRPTMSFCEVAVVTATCPRAVDDLLTGLTIHRARVKQRGSFKIKRIMSGSQVLLSSRIIPSTFI